MVLRVPFAVASGRPVFRLIDATGTWHDRPFAAPKAYVELAARPPFPRRLCEHMFVSYVELHCHSAFSFLDGASLPDELVAAAVERGHTALALTDHDTVCGSMEFAQAAAAARACARSTAPSSRCSTAGMPIERRAPPDAARPRRARLDAASAGCSRARWAHTREADARRSLGAPSVTLADVEEHAEGLVCLSGCARRGVRDEPTMRRLLAAFGRDALPGRAPAAVRPPRPHAATAGSPRSPSGSGVPCVATGNVHAHAPMRAPPAGRVRRRARAHDARRLRAAAPRQPRARPGHARGDGRALRGPSRRGRRDRAARRDADASTSRSDLGYRYPGAEDDDGDRALAAGLRAPASTTRYAAGHRAAATRRPRRLERGARADRRARAVGLLPAAPRHARARARGRGRGPRARTPPARCCRPAAGAGPRSPRSSATSPASRTSTRSRTSSSSGASSTTRSPRCRTSTSTSRATCASG